MIWGPSFNQHAQTGLLAAVMVVFFSFPMSAAVTNMALLMMLLFWLASGQWADKWSRIRHNPGLWFALGLYAWMCLGILYTDAPASDIVTHLRKYMKLLLMALVVCALSEAVWRRRAWTVYVAALLFTLASTYANIWIDLPWSVSDNQGWNMDHTVFKDYISQGILMSMFVAIGLSQIIKADNSLRRKWVWAVLSALSILSITHLSDGRSAYLALIAAVLGFVFWATQGWRRWLGMGLVTLGLAGVFTTSSVMQSRVELAVHQAQNLQANDFSSVGQRLYYAQKSFELIADKPVFGWGTGAYHQMFCRLADSAQWCMMGKVHPHNQILFIWVEHGLLGLALLFGLMFTPVWMTRHAPAHIRGLAAAYTGIFLVSSMTHGSLWLSTESHFHTLMGALLFAGYPHKRA